MTETGGIKKTISDLQNEEIENRLCLMHEIRGGLDSGGEIIGYVYRVNQDKSRTALPPVNDFLMDADFGLMHGPGAYNVSYFQRTDANVLKPLKTISYKIGREFMELHKNYCAENNLPCYLIENNLPVNGPQTGLINYLDSDKLKAAAGFLGALKLILAPDAGAGSNLNVILEQNRELIKGLVQPRENISESIVNQAFKMLANPSARSEHQQPQQLDIFEQAKNFKAMKELFSDDKTEMEPAENMQNKMIEKAMENLPAILDLFKGHIPSAAKHLKKSKPFEAAALRLNPKLQADFYSAISAKFGPAAAQIWAKEYGINPNNLIPFKPAARPIEHAQEVKAEQTSPPPEKLKKVVF